MRLKTYNTRSTGKPHTFNILKGKTCSMCKWQFLYRVPMCPGKYWISECFLPGPVKLGKGPLFYLSWKKSLIYLLPEFHDRK